MRVIHVIDSLALGGAEVMAATLAREHRAVGHAVSFQCLFERGSLGRQLQAEGFAVELIGPAASAVLSRRLLQRFRALRPDVVHCHNAAATVTAAWPARLSGARAISTRHGLVAPPYGRVAALKYALAAAACRHVVGVCDATVANLGRFPLLRRSALTRVYNGAACPPGERGESQAPAGLCLVSVGRLVPLKNFAGLLRAVARARAPEPGEAEHEVRLTIVGGGPHAAELRRLATELGLLGAVTWAGEQRNIWPYLQAADAFVLASQSEGLPISLLEAMGAGLPSIVSDVGGMPEAVRAANAGLVVPRGDDAALAAAILRLAGDRVLRQKMGAAAQAGYHRLFSPRAMAQAYLRVYGCADA